MKTLITKLLGVLLDKLKTKNSIIFMIIQAVLVAVYIVMTKGVELGIFPDSSIFTEGVQYLSMLLMALIGTNTVTDLPEDFDPANLKELLAKVLDSFKANNPTIFAIIQIILLTGFGVLTYGGFPLTATLQTVLQVITMLGVVLTGSRTVKFIIPEDQARAMRSGATSRPLEYYD